MQFALEIALGLVLQGSHQLSTETRAVPVCIQFFYGNLKGRLQRHGWRHKLQFKCVSEKSLRPYLLHNINTGSVKR